MKAPGWQVAVVSYQRAAQLRDHTLATFARGGVPAKAIDVWVASKEQAAEYREILVKGTYAQIHIGVLGMCGVRNCVTDAYPDGQAIVHADDDIRGVFSAVSPKQLLEVENLGELFDSGFEACKAVKARLWGLYPICNPFYMHGGQAMTTDLRPILGVLHGNFNDRSARLTRFCKEDIERTLLYYEKDGAVVRFNNLAPKQIPHSKGGLSSTRTPEVSEADAAYLCKRWPQWVTRKPGFKRGHAEVKLSAKKLR